MKLNLSGFVLSREVVWFAYSVNFCNVGCSPVCLGWGTRVGGTSVVQRKDNLMCIEIVLLFSPLPVLISSTTGIGIFLWEVTSGDEVVLQFLSPKCDWLCCLSVSVVFCRLIHQLSKWPVLLSPPSNANTRHCMHLISKNRSSVCSCSFLTACFVLTKL